MLFDTKSGVKNKCFPKKSKGYRNRKTEKIDASIVIIRRGSWLQNRLAWDRWPMFLCWLNPGLVGEVLRQIPHYTV